MKTELIPMYVKDRDITFVMLETYDDNNEHVSSEVTGFYYGEPTAYDTELFNGHRKAVYTEKEVQR